MRFFSVVRFIPVTVCSSWIAGRVRSGFSPNGAGLPNFGGTLVRHVSSTRGLRVGRGLRLLRAGPLRLRPVLEVALRAAGDGERPRGHVAAYDGAAGRAGAVADRDRRDEGVVGPGLRVPADRRAALGDSVVVGEDRAGADVGALADLGVADV